MRVCIHRGTQQIGGTCVEIESQGRRIVLDVGLPLDAASAADVVMPAVAGFAAPDPSLLGVVISHPHQDHYGLAHRLPPGTPFLIGQAAQSILAAADIFTPAGATFVNVTHLQDRIPIAVGPFTVTPFLVDHSAYDAYAMLVGRTESVCSIRAICGRTAGRASSSNSSFTIRLSASTCC